MVKYMQTLPGIEDPVMADGTTVFSVALAKSNCDVIKELILSRRRRDNDLARCALNEPKLNEDVRKILIEAIGTITHEGPQIQLSRE